MNVLVSSCIETDLGTMMIVASEKGICLFGFVDGRYLDLELRLLSAALKAPLVRGESPYFEMLEKQVRQYFDGERRDFTVPLDLVGTVFQKQVWLSLLQIPYGSTTNYAKQAALVGKPSAVRAVAAANGKNKISIVLPCHRIVGADGSPTGYAGGIWRKKKLLELERSSY